MGRSLVLLIWLSLLFSSNVDESERVVFKSANPFSFYHIVTELEAQEEQEEFCKPVTRQIQNQYIERGVDMDMGIGIDLDG